MQRNTLFLSQIFLRKGASWVKQWQDEYKADEKVENMMPEFLIKLQEKILYSHYSFFQNHLLSGRIFTINNLSTMLSEEINRRSLR